MIRVIAIDGPAGAGKSTAAKLLAKKLGFHYLDTGAMYRAVTYLILKKNILIDNQEQIRQFCQEITIEFLPPDKKGNSRIIINNIDVTDKIRTELIDRNVSLISRNKTIRDTMLKLQRNIAKTGNIILDGRDIGSRVLPDADIKFFITASLEERARRRWNEKNIVSTGFDFNEIKKNIYIRDKEDIEREVSPLIQTSDAIVIDTTSLTIEEVVEKMIDIIKGEANV